MMKKTKSALALAAFLAALSACGCSASLAVTGTDAVRVEDIVFGYHDANVFSGEPCYDLNGADSQEEYEDMLEENGLGGRFPYFGNPLTLEGTEGMVKNDLWEQCLENEPVYSAVYDPLYAYATDLAETYDNLVKMSYTVENDGKTLSVAFDNTAYPNGLEGEPVCFGRTFTYDIEDASLDRLPALDEESAAFVDPLYEKYYGAGYEEIRESYVS